MLTLNLKDKSLINIGTEGGNYWNQNGKCHRYNGPGVEYANGAKYWYQNGKRHREDGPAIENPDGVKYWYLNGKLQPHHS